MHSLWTRHVRSGRRLLWNPVLEMEGPRTCLDNSLYAYFAKLIICNSRLSFNSKMNLVFPSKAIKESCLFRKTYALQIARTEVATLPIRNGQCKSSRLRQFWQMTCIWGFMRPNYHLGVCLASRWQQTFFIRKTVCLKKSLTSSLFKQKGAF